MTTITLCCTVLIFVAVLSLGVRTRLGGWLVRFSTGLSLPPNRMSWLTWHVYQLILTVRDFQGGCSQPPCQPRQITCLSPLALLMLHNHSNTMANKLMVFLYCGDKYRISGHMSRMASLMLHPSLLIDLSYFICSSKQAFSLIKGISNGLLYMYSTTQETKKQGEMSFLIIPSLNSAVYEWFGLRMGMALALVS